MKFSTEVELGGKTATGFQVPDDVVAALGSGRRPAVRITIGHHSYRSTLATMGGRSMVPLSAEHREAAGVGAGDRISVDIEIDAAPRTVDVPEDMTSALGQDASVRTFFDSLSYSQRKEWVRWVEEAKKPETRSARISKSVEALRTGKRTH